MLKSGSFGGKDIGVLEFASLVGLLAIAISRRRCSVGVAALLVLFCIIFDQVAGRIFLNLSTLFFLSSSQNPMMICSLFVN